MSNSPILQGLLSANPELAVNPQPQAPLAAAQAPNPNAPRVPPPQVPLRQDTSIQPEDEPDVETHPVDDMASAFMNHLINKDKQAMLGDDNKQPAPPPGSFGSKVQGALSAASRGLGDAAAGANAKGGWLSSVAATLNARSNRLKDEEAAAFEKSERLKNDQLNLARTNIAMRQEAMAMQKQEKEVRDSSASQGSAFINDLRDNYKVTDNISQDELNKMVQKDPNYLRTHTARITGYKPVIDANGNEKIVDGVAVEEPQWSIVDLAPGDMSKQFKVTPAMSKRWADAGLATVAPGTVMPVTAAATMDSRAQRYSSTINILNHDKVVPLSNEVKDALATTLQDEEVQHAISSKPGSVLDGLYEAKKNIADHIANLQANIGKAQGPGAADSIQQQLKHYQDISANLDKAVTMGFTDQERKDYAKQVSDDAHQALTDKRENERILHDRNTEMIALDKIKALQQSSDPAAAQELGGYLADGLMDPSQLSKRAKNYNATIEAAMAISMQKYGMPFEIAQAGTDYKYAGQKSTKDTLNFLNSLTGSDNKSGNLGTLLQQSNALPRATSIPAIDDKVMWAKLESGIDGPAVAAYHTTITEVADQVAKILQGGGSGGGTSDAKLRQAQELFRTGYSKEMMDSVIKDLRDLLANRKTEMIGKNRYLIREYGNAQWKPGMTAADTQQPNQPQKPPPLQVGQIVQQGTQKFKILSLDASGKPSQTEPVQ